MMNRMAFRNYQPMNMVFKSKYGTQLWLGDYYAATDEKLLKSKNIKAVLTSAAMLNIAYTKQIQIKHKIINAFDIPSYKMTPHFEEAFKFIDENLQKGNVFVHCAAGISRSTTFVLVYMMRSQGYSFKQSLEIVKGRRPIVNPNYGFQNQLKRYELYLKKIDNKKEEGKQEKKNQIVEIQTSKQKDAVLNFLSNENQKNQENLNKRFNLTLGNSSIANNNVIGGVSGNKNPYNGFLRGKSSQYTHKNPNLSNTIGYGNSSKLGNNQIITSNHSTNIHNRLQSLGNKQKLVNPKKQPSSLTSPYTPLNNQFLTFKLQTPKIVTIKK